jgi:hypothetical protein
MKEGLGWMDQGKKGEGRMEDQTSQGHTWRMWKLSLRSRRWTALIARHMCQTIGFPSSRRYLPRVELAVVAIVDEVVPGVVLTLVTFGVSVSVSVSTGATRDVVVAAVGTTAGVVDARADVLTASGVVDDVGVTTGVVTASGFEDATIGVAEETGTTPDETAT